MCVLLSYSITFCSFSSNARTQSPFVFSSYFCKKKKILTQVVCFTNFRKKQNKHSYNFFSLPDHIISLLIPSFNPVQTLKSHNMMRGRSRPGRLWMLFAADFAGQFTAVQNCYHVIHAKAYLLDCLKFYTSQPALASS